MVENHFSIPECDVKKRIRHKPWHREENFTSHSAILKWQPYWGSNPRLQRDS